MDERTENPVVVFMPEIDRENLGGTMRLGLRNTIWQPDSEWSKLRALYSESSTSEALSNGVTSSSHLMNGASNETANGTPVSAPFISERHRHRYEVNPSKIHALPGLHFVGKDETGQRQEVLELKQHPFFVGVQFHPEYLSRVLQPSKPYLGLVAASAGVLDEVMGGKGRKLSNGTLNGMMNDEGSLLAAQTDGVRI
ncbi:CTP synthase ura7 [Mycoblastus sanguinarius]|nr:CTP synthase ura7 [Mycoblastus sanguinarius]